MINNLRYIYADDTVVIAESEKQLQSLINVIVADSKEKGMMLNMAKYITMVFSKSPTVPKCKSIVNYKFLEQIESFIYLGANFTSDGRCEKEIRRRIIISRSTINSMKDVLTSKSG